MSWSVNSSLAHLRKWWGTLAFRLTAGYAISGLLTVFFATASLYVVLITNLDRSTNLFLADKVNVLQTMLRERPNDVDALREEIELESAARRYERFYIRLLDDRGNLLMATPGMADQLDLQQLVTETQDHPNRATAMTGKKGRALRVLSTAVPVGSSPTQQDIIQIAVDISQEEVLLARYRHWFIAIMLGTFVVFPVAGYQIARRG